MNKPNLDPQKAFNAIADIISEREGVKIAVKSVRKRDMQQSA